jgi:peroxiredoxin
LILRGNAGQLGVAADEPVLTDQDLCPRHHAESRGYRKANDTTETSFRFVTHEGAIEGEGLHMMTIVLLLLILISLWIGLFQIVKQQGRILLHLDQLEQQAQAARVGVQKPAAQAEPAGLPLQSEFPAFKFPDLTGKTVALEAFRGKRVLLVHWNFECGFCDSIAAELSRLETAFQKQNVQLVLLTYGDAKSNQEQAAEHGLKCPILLMKEEEKAAPFEHLGTPVAYLLDKEGRVAAPLAHGADRVLALALEVAAAEPGASGAGKSTLQPSGLGSEGPLAETLAPHRVNLPGFLVKHEIGLGDVIKRLTSAFGIKTCVGCERRAGVLNRWMVFSSHGGSGLKAGVRAPAFILPDLQGRMVSLDQYRGRRVLLVFTDPQCGPCDELAPHLVRLHREYADDGLGVILVGRGNAKENHRKAEQHGFEFPVLLQDKKWKVSREYGTLATPVAFLIGEDGEIASGAAVGRDAILALVRHSQGSQKGGVK